MQREVLQSLWTSSPSLNIAVGIHVILQGELKPAVLTRCLHNSRFLALGFEVLHYHKRLLYNAMHTSLRWVVQNSLSMKLEKDIHFLGLH